MLTLTMFAGMRRARADPAPAVPAIETSGAVVMGVMAAGVGPPRFVLSPSASASLRWSGGGFLVLRDVASFLGTTGGRFGINNETTLAGGAFWERVNLSGGLTLAQYWMPICGPQLCGQVLGLAPGLDVRLDVFGPYLAGALGIAVDCGATWIVGHASPVWSGASLRCSAGPILRFLSRS